MPDLKRRIYRVYITIVPWMIWLQYVYQYAFLNPPFSLLSLLRRCSFLSYRIMACVGGSLTSLVHFKPLDDLILPRSSINGSFSEWMQRNIGLHIDEQLGLEGT
jgi:hypothetical protein